LNSSSYSTTNSSSRRNLTNNSTTQLNWHNNGTLNISRDTKAKGWEELLNNHHNTINNTNNTNNTNKTNSWGCPNDPRPSVRPSFRNELALVTTGTMPA
jgi:hypothetical protein